MRRTHWLQVLSPCRPGVAGTTGCCTLCCPPLPSVPTHAGSSAAAMVFGCFGKKSVDVVPMGPEEPTRFPEAFRRRPRVSKKRSGGAKVELVLFYSSKWEPKGIPKGPKASKMSPEASQRRPEGAQECQRSVQEAQSSIYSCFIAFSSDQGHSPVWGGEP